MHLLQYYGGMVTLANDFCVISDLGTTNMFVIQEQSIILEANLLF